MEPVKSKRGGARPGSGRKPKNAPLDGADLLGGGPDAESTTIGTVQKDATPLDFLEATFRNPLAPDGVRLRAAIAAAQYRHKKMADGGIKDAAKVAAEKAGKGKFSPGAAPQLAASNGKKVA